MAKEYMLAHLLEEPRREHTEFQSWPAHITVLPWFVCRDLVTVEDAIEEICAQTEPVIVQTGPLVYLGSKHDKLARNVIKPPALQMLHVAALDVLKHEDSKAILQDKIEYFGNDYNPHISKYVGYEEDDALIIDQLSIVGAEEVIQGGTRMKTVVRNFSLGTNAETSA